MIEFSCSKCGERLRVQESAAGRQGACPRCRASLVVPQPGAVNIEIAGPVTPVAAPPPVVSHDSWLPHDIPNQQRQKHRRWVALMIVGAILSAPFIPKFPLWLGIGICVLCIAFFVGPLRRIPESILRLKNRSGWDRGSRVVMYAILGGILITSGVYGFQMKDAMAEAAAKRAADEAERARLTTEANQKVSELVATAIQKLKAGDVDSAKQSAEAATRVPHATANYKASQIVGMINRATDVNAVRKIMMDLRDEEFQILKNEQRLPPQLSSGYDVLDKLTKEIAVAQAESVATAREQRRLAAIQAQKDAEERAKREAEAARKAEEERVAREAAAREAAKAERKSLLDKYIAVLNAADVQLVDSVSVGTIAGDHWEATITVKNVWHLRAYQIRYQDAQALWDVWSRIASPNNRDKARIKIVDQRGNEVGGSRLLAGSLIWVQKD
ncbi:MAG TPA: hypothetical protein P5081_19750 [Phycisphaerae bacterium]|nr:hypothetical protein [Phycisphaerae bacterium]